MFISSVWTTVHFSHNCTKVLDIIRRRLRYLKTYRENVRKCWLNEYLVALQTKSGPAKGWRATEEGCTSAHKGFYQEQS